MLTNESYDVFYCYLCFAEAFAMINECDPDIACWTAEGDKFVVKNKEVFAAKVIPQYYDHNNYSSFTRQLNFYGFTREQSMTIKVNDLNSLAVGQETFYHQYFQRGRPDLLKNLQRRASGDSKNGKKRKKPKTADDATVAVLQGKLEALEQQTTEMLSSMQQMREENFASATAIRDLQNLNSAKDAQIASLEKRVEWLESRLPSSSFPQQQPQPGSSSFLPQGQRLSSAPSRESSRAWSFIDTALARQALNENSLTSFPTEGAGSSSYQQQPSASQQAAEPTLAPHPRMKKYYGNNNIGGSNPPKEIFSFENSGYQGPPSREASLDLGLLSSLGREHSMMSWLPRQETENNQS